MKKLLLFLLLFITVQVTAQNIQLLGGSNEKKEFINFVTIELYKPLKYGALYYFTDFKMNKYGYREAYTEISKYWNIRDIGSVTAQLNVGLNKDFQIKPVYLLGISKAIKYGNFDLSIDIMYRNQRDLITYDEINWGNNGYQITTIFCQNLDKIQISGYLDFWNSKYYMFEPQAWYKLFKQTWLGLEWRASNYNVLGEYENYFMFGLKWNME